MDNMHIYVSICSHRDHLLHYTLESLIETKSKRHEATYAIFEQTHKEQSLEVLYPELVARHDVIYKRIDPEYTHGVCWARHVNMTLVEEDKHDFIYQIDSHMLHDPDWDRMLIEDYKRARDLNGSDKVIISGSTKAYTLVNEVPTNLEYMEGCTSKVAYFCFDRRYGIPGAHGDLRPGTEMPTPSFHIMAGCFFTKSSWAREVGVNPKAWFSIEEPLMSLMSYERGWRIFHPTSCMSYHYDNASTHTSKQWIDPVVSNEYISQGYERGYKIWADYIENIREDVLQSFYEDYGIDFINLKIDDRARTFSIMAPPDLRTPNDDEAIARRMSNQVIQINIPEQEKPENTDANGSDVQEFNE